MYNKVLEAFDYYKSIFLESKFTCSCISYDVISYIVIV